MALNTTGSSNLSFGKNSLYNNTTGSGNIAIGENAMFLQTAGTENVAVGGFALELSSGNFNVGIGPYTLRNSTGSDLTATGYHAMTANTTGYSNAAFGSFAMANNLTGHSNCAFGYYSLYTNTSGRENTTAGFESMKGNTTGNDNAAFGWSALRACNGSDNVAFGAHALHTQTTGSRNTAVGRSAMDNGAGNDNVAIGYNAASNTKGTVNTAVGSNALPLNSTGSQNVAIGADALANNSTGIQNVAVGNAALSIVTNENTNTGVGFAANIASAGITNASAFGFGSIVTANDEVELGGATNSAVRCVSGNYLTGSDQRFKKNVSENDVKGLEFIMKLRPVSYNFDTKKLTEHVTKNMPDSMRAIYLGQNFEASTAIRRSGFLAQEIEKAANEVGYDFDGLSKPKNEVDFYSVSYATFVVPLVKAVQQQQKQIEEQNSEIQNLKNQIASLSSNKTASDAQILGMNNGLNDNGNILLQNEPNPFATETTINYSIVGSASSCALVIYDLTGKQIKSQPIENKKNGTVVFTSENLPAGIYYYSILADNKILATKKMVISGK